MYKWLIPAAASVALLGCNSESGGGSSGSGELNVTLKSPTFVIDADSRGAIDDSVAESTLSVSALDFADVAQTRSTVRSASGMRSGIQPRISESETSACFDGGSVTFAVNGDGINDQGDFSSNGTVTVSITSDNCTYDYGTGYEVEDGGAKVTLSWAGYNGSDAFDSLSVTALFDEMSYEDYDNSDALIYSENIDGGIKASLADNESEVKIALSMQSSDFNNQIITIETTTTVKQRLSDSYPYQGVVEVKGGNGTSVVYTVVPNGVEVSLNGEQPVLVTWNEI